MTQDDAKMIADTIGAVIARERKATRDELKAAIAEARTALLAEVRALVAESRAAELEKVVERLLGGAHPPPQQLRGSTSVLTLPRRSA